MLATCEELGAAAVRDFMVDQRLRDDAIDLAAGVEHGVGDDPHQAEPPAAIDQVDAALGHLRPSARAASANAGSAPGAEPQ